MTRLESYIFWFVWFKTMTIKYRRSVTGIITAIGYVPTQRTLKLVSANCRCRSNGWVALCWFLRSSSSGLLQTAIGYKRSFNLKYYSVLYPIFKM